MLTRALATALVAYELSLLLYFVALNSIYGLFVIVAYFRLRRHRRMWTPRELGAVMRSPATPPISVIAPAFNEETTLVESIRSLLFLNYPQFEVVIVNDGSRDRTLQVALDTFNLVPAPAGPSGPIETQPVLGVYRSVSNRDIVLIDKVNGGKADAMNAGINVARHPLVCVIDVDSLLEEHALTRAVLPFLEDPATIAAGGIVRIANGCTVEDGRVTKVGLPREPLAVFQVIEYLRSFLAGRVAQSAINAVLIISGAFGLFKRDAVVAVGGFRHDTIGEDMELVTRLHRIYREKRERYRIVFQPDPVCWTEAPDSARILANQRNRWQRGTLQVLGFHPTMLFNPRYGVIGLMSMPFYLVFEACGPVVEIVGYAVTLLAVGCGLLDWHFAELLFLAAIVFGTLISLASLFLEEISFRRYPRTVDLLRLTAYAILENFGYRQLATIWRLQGTVDFFRKKRGWGDMTRKGFAH